MRDTANEGGASQRWTASSRGARLVLSQVPGGRERSRESQNRTTWRRFRGLGIERRPSDVFAVARTGRVSRAEMADQQAAADGEAESGRVSEQSSVPARSSKISSGRTLRVWFSLARSRAPSGGYARTGFTRANHLDESIAIGPTYLRATRLTAGRVR